MFHHYYATTKDRKNNEHNYRLASGERVPNGHEITSLSVASRFKFAELIGEDKARELKELFPARKGKN